MKIAIIPARGGSKRIPKKNIKLFKGLPIIAYAIKTAISCKVFDRVIVSTDSFEIANIAREYGAEVPFMRPELISGDLTATKIVIDHAIREICDLNKISNVDVCCIYPATPLLKPDDLMNSFKMFKDSDSLCVFAANEYSHPVERAIIANKNSFIEPLFENGLSKRTQDCRQILHDAGQFYWSKASTWIDPDFQILGRCSQPYMLAKFQAVDIDDEEDWLLAESIFELINKQNST